jgi:hypothetical protein
LAASCIAAAVQRIAIEAERHRFTFRQTRRPICWTKDLDRKDLGDKDKQITFIATFPIPIKWLGHYVIITGNMVAGDSWGLRVQRIEDVK